MFSPYLSLGCETMYDNLQRFELQSLCVTISYVIKTDPHNNATPATTKIPPDATNNPVTATSPAKPIPDAIAPAFAITPRPVKVAVAPNGMPKHTAGTDSKESIFSIILPILSELICVPVLTGIAIPVGVGPDRLCWRF